MAWRMLEYTVRPAAKAALSSFRRDQKQLSRCQEASHERGGQGLGRSGGPGDIRRHRRARASQSSPESLPGCQKAGAVRRAARLSGGLSGRLPGRQEACREGCQAARRPSPAFAVGQQSCRAVQEAPETTATHRNPAQLKSSQRSELCKWPAMGLDLLHEARWTTRC